MNMSYIVLIIAEICGIAIIHNWGWADKPNMSKSKKMEVHDNLVFMFVDRGSMACLLYR